MNYLYPDDLEIEEEPMPSPLYRKYGRTYIDASIQPRMFEHEDLPLFSLPDGTELRPYRCIVRANKWAADQEWIRYAASPAKAEESAQQAVDQEFFGRGGLVLVEEQG